MKRVRELARKENRQISQVVNDLLVAGLAARAKRSATPFELPTFRMGRPTVNLGDRDALESLMDS